MRLRGWCYTGKESERPSPCCYTSSCVDSVCRTIEMGDEIASGRIKYWIKDRSLKLKLHAIVGRQKFMNCCGKCVVIKHQIVAKFHNVPKGFVKVRTLPKRRNTLVGRELLQTTHRRLLLLPFRSKTHMTCEMIAMQSGTSKPWVHRVWAEVLEKVKVAVRSMTTQHQILRKL